MLADTDGAARPGPTVRCWRFGNARFDEAAWALFVDDARVALENKPLQLLRELLRRPGEVVGKDMLLDAVWPGVTVVEGSLTTAMNKLRRALGDSEGQIIETVPGIGYRLAVPVRGAGDSPLPVAPPADGSAVVAPSPKPAGRVKTWLGAGALLAVAGLAAAAALPAPERPMASAVKPVEVVKAMRRLDLVAVHEFIDEGWSPLAPMDDERNDALNKLLEICEWNPDHDRRRLQQMVWLLLDSGARPDVRNVWGDTAYSIARSRRYCGPDHPATRQLRLACLDRAGRLRPACLPDYAHSEWPQHPIRRAVRHLAD